MGKEELDDGAVLAPHSEAEKRHSVLVAGIGMEAGPHEQPDGLGIAIPRALRQRLVMDGCPQLEEGGPRRAAFFLDEPFLPLVPVVGREFAQAVEDGKARKVVVEDMGRVEAIESEVRVAAVSEANDEGEPGGSEARLGGQGEEVARLFDAGEDAASRECFPVRVDLEAIGIDPRIRERLEDAQEE